MKSNPPTAQFIATEPFAKGEAGERQVWKRIKSAFAQRHCLAYWRYPIFAAGKYRREPDIFVADAELGLIVIEVKAVRIEQIVGINGHLWQYQDFYITQGNPYQQAEQQLYALIAYRECEPTLPPVAGRVLVALPQITSTQWQERGFDQLPTSPPILFQDTPDLLAAIQQTLPLTPGQPLSPQQWQLLLSTLAGTPLYTQPSHRVLTSLGSRGKLLQSVRSQIIQLDVQQERIAKQIPPGLQRIRGIAGSGKTVLLCQKAAHMHLKHPDWDLAVVFFSRSLYHTIRQQIDAWLRHFSNNQQGYNPDSKLQILHGWGSSQQPGLYSTLCQRTCTHKLTVKDVQARLTYRQTQSPPSKGRQPPSHPQTLLNLACTHLLQSSPIPPCFDAILIDEAQDFLVEPEFKYQGKQPFFWLAYQALRPIDPVHPEQRRLIWAYDELQSFTTLGSLNASELLGEELGHLVTGTYRDGIQKTEILTRCYRTPHPIITAAHALGMGLLRPEGMLTGISRLEDWQALGYEVQHVSPQSGWESAQQVLLPQQQCTLHRPAENSPNPLSDSDQDVIDFRTYPTRQSELSTLATKITGNLRYDGLRPSREILVLVLGHHREAKRLQAQTAKFLLNQGIDIYLPGSPACNCLNSDHDRPEQFWCEGAVTVSHLHRAKGQEADMVYVIGLDQIAQAEQNLQLRQQLLVGLTRARAWVRLSGIGTYPFYTEVHHVLQSRDSLRFTYTPGVQREITITTAGELQQRYARRDRNFQNLHLPSTHLVGINLAGANLLQAQLTHTNLSYANLEGTNLVIADLSHAQLIQAKLKKAKLVGATLCHSYLNGADLSYADLSYADLTQAQLIGANLTQTNLNGAILAGADLTDTQFESAESARTE